MMLGGTMVVGERRLQANAGGLGQEPREMLTNSKKLVDRIESIDDALNFYEFLYWLHNVRRKSEYAIGKFREILDRMAAGPPAGNPVKVRLNLAVPLNVLEQVMGWIDGFFFTPIDVEGIGPTRMRDVFSALELAIPKRGVRLSTELWMGPPASRGGEQTFKGFTHEVPANVEAVFTKVISPASRTPLETDFREIAEKADEIKAAMEKSGVKLEGAVAPLIAAIFAWLGRVAAPWLFRFIIAPAGRFLWRLLTTGRVAAAATATGAVIDPITGAVAVAAKTVSWKGLISVWSTLGLVGWMAFTKEGQETLKDVQSIPRNTIGAVADVVAEVRKGVAMATKVLIAGGVLLTLGGVAYWIFGD